MRQPSLFSDEAIAPTVADLGGMLCAHAQIVGFGNGSAARLSVVVDDGWRAAELVRACRARGLSADQLPAEDDRLLVRTAFHAELVRLALRWTRGAVKAVPEGLQLDGTVLRLWAVVAGSSDRGGFRLGLDPHAESTHQPLAERLAAAGMAATLLGARAGGPALRVVGRRRVARLAELVGDPPPGADPAVWPG